jgi:uncharacterized membrane protein YhaH (DUF805 family)
MKERRAYLIRSSFAVALLGACVGLAWLAAATPPVVQLRLAQGGALALRRGGATFQWVAVATAVLLAPASWAALRRAFIASPPPALAAPLRVLAPLAWLPWAVLPILLGDRLPCSAVSAAVPLVCVPVAWCLLRAAETWLAAASDESPARDRRAALAILILSTAAYTWMGYRLSVRVGEHVGDEGHYLAQAQSLYLDGDLDLRNDIMERAVVKPPARGTRAFCHVSAASRGDAWYSYHPYGLSLILAPFWGWGMPFRQFLLALIAAAGNVAIFLLSRRAGAGRRAAALATVALGSSYVWAMYAVRALPETLGASLLCWAVWAVVAQRDRPWATVWPGALCCAGMVMAHERFITLSLMAFGFYGLFGLCAPGRWVAKIARLGVFTVLCALGYGLYIGSQFLLYDGGMKYSIEGGFMDYPPGMWGVVADAQGIVPVLPVFVWMAAALPAWVKHRRDRWAAAGMTAAIVAVCFIFSCPNRFYIGGSCVPGRYLLAVVPLLVPGAAVVFERTHRAGRAWFLYLCVLSTSLLVLVLPNLRVLGRNFILPIHTLKRSLPLLAGLYHPHASYLFMTDRTAQHATTVYVAAALGLTLLMLLVPRRRGALAWAALPPIVALGALAHLRQPADWRCVPQPPTQAARLIATAVHEGMTVEVLGHGEFDMAAALRAPFPDIVAGSERTGVTTRDLGTPRRGLLFSQPRLEENDWAGRGIRWATLTRPFRPPPGRMVLRMDGELSGSATLFVAVREGPDTLFEGAAQPDEEGAVNLTLSFTCTGRRGNLCILARIEGDEGTFTVSDMYWTPWAAARALVPESDLITGH